MRKYLFLPFACLLVSAAFCPGQGLYDRNRVSESFQRQDYDNVIQYLQSSDLAQDTSARLKTDLGYAYFMNEQYREAAVQFRTLYGRNPADIKANLYLAQVHELLRNPDSALFFYTNLRRLQSLNYRFWQKSAQLFSDLTQYDSALACIERSYNLNLRSGRVAVQYVNLLTRSKQYERIEALIQEFLWRDSSNEDMMVKRVEVSFRKPDYPTVIFWAERLLRDSAEVTIPYIDLAYSYLNTDSIDKCIALCDWMIFGNRAAQPLLYCAALAYARKKNFGRSNELLDECLKMSLQDDAVSYFNAKSDNYEEMKQYGKAISYYDTSYYLFHSPPDLYYAGRVYDKYLGNKGKAKVYYKLFLEKRRAPKNSGEVKVFEYIRKFLGDGKR
jgi:tetratricopeptide (TPR) repeat protein